MAPRHPADRAKGSEEAEVVPAKDGIYDCLLCGTSWGYADIQNTARCPACGGGLVRHLTHP